MAIIDLPEGEFEYKFEVDGEWRLNTKDEKKTNEEGHENNVITIDESHFAELENELLKDPNDINIPDPFTVSHTTQLKQPGEKTSMLE